MNERDETLLRDMLDAARTALRFVQGRVRADFDSDEMLAFATVRAVEIVGEAASKVTELTRTQTPQIEWKAIIGMRNRIVHDYLSVDYDIVWDVVTADLPKLIAELERLLSFQDE